MLYNLFQRVLSLGVKKVTKAVVVALVVLLVGSLVLPITAKAAPQNAPLAKVCYTNGEIFLIGQYGKQHSWIHRVYVHPSNWNRVSKAFWGNFDITTHSLTRVAGSDQERYRYVDFWVSSLLGNMIYPRNRVSTRVVYFC